MAPDLDGYYTLTACRVVACAILSQAVKDARQGDGAAMAWVLGPEALAWADVLGFEQWPPKIKARRGRRGGKLHFL
jgi:hypothetical protein